MRKLSILMLALLVLLSAGSCKLFDMLFYKAPGVSPEDLGSYTGTLPTNRDDTLMAIGMGGMVTMMMVGEHVGTSSAWTGAFPPSAMSAFNAIPTVKLLAPFISKVKAKSITVSQTGFGSDSLDKEFHLDIENEAVDVVGMGGAGALTIDKCKADLSATLSASTPPFSGDGEGEADVLITGSNLKASPSDTVTVNSAQVGVKAKGKMSFEADGSIGGPTSLEYNIAADAKAGFSISAGDGASGKFIIEMNYIDSGSFTKAQLTDPTGAYFDPSTAVSNIEFTITIKVYDNANDLAHEYELNQDDLATLAGGMP
jgi:hypothetical protein